MKIYDDIKRPSESKVVDGYSVTDIRSYYEFI